MYTRSTTLDAFFANALPMLEEVVYTEMETYPDLIKVLSNYETGTGWGTQSTEITGLKPAIPIAEGASVTFDDPVQGNSKTFTYVKWGIGIKVSEELIDDEKHGQIRDVHRAMGSSMHHTRQQVFMNNFNNGFAINGYDGVPFFSTLHPLVKAGGVEANKPAVDVDLSVASLRAALTQIHNWFTHEGLRAFFTPRTLLVSTADVYAAIELTKSDYRPDTANNAINAFTSWDLQPVASPYLTDNDAWFIGCTRHYLKWIERKSPEVSSFPDWDAGAAKTKIISRFDTGHTSWYGWWGTAGA